jgi:hypothetical protein
VSSWSRRSCCRSSHSSPSGRVVPLQASPPRRRLPLARCEADIDVRSVASGFILPFLRAGEVNSATARPNSDRFMPARTAPRGPNRSEVEPPCEGPRLQGLSPLSRRWNVPSAPAREPFKVLRGPASTSTMSPGHGEAILRLRSSLFFRPFHGQNPPLGLMPRSSARMTIKVGRHFRFPVASTAARPRPRNLVWCPRNSSSHVSRHIEHRHDGRGQLVSEVHHRCLCRRSSQPGHCDA